jgi:holin-like protein
VRFLNLAGGFALILLFWVLGEALAAWAALPVPGSVLGMLLLTAALRLRIVLVPAVRPAAEVLVRYMALFFVPPGVGVLLYLELLRAEWLALALASLAGLLAVLFTVGLLQQRLEGDA